MEPFTIEALRARTYPGGVIQVKWTYTTTQAYTRYFVDYPSDDLMITGVMCVPHGEGPFPVVILNHGYIPPRQYWSGADTWYASDYLARQGYLTLAPDFRGWGESDDGDNYFRTGLVIDALNLISSLPSLPRADPGRVGMWGHSMGSGLATKALTIDPRILAAVLYGPVSADDRVTTRRWGRRATPIAPEDSTDLAYRRALADRRFLQRTSALPYLDGVSAAVQIHTGTEDTVTPPRWAQTIRDALRTAGREVEYYAYEGEGHTFHGKSWDLFMERVTHFFDRHLKGP